jgi:hypothetical protein
MSNWKVNWATIFYLFQSQCLLKRKINRRACSVSLYYFTKVCFIFKVSYHLLCENYHDNDIFLLNNTGGHSISKPSRCKKLFVTDVKGFPCRFFSSQIFVQRIVLHFLEIYSFMTKNLPQSCNRSGRFKARKIYPGIRKWISQLCREQV